MRELHNISWFGETFSCLPCAGASWRASFLCLMYVTYALCLCRSVRWFKETQTSAVKNTTGTIQQWFHGIISRR